MIFISKYTVSFYLVFCRTGKATAKLEVKTKHTTKTSTYLKLYQLNRQNVDLNPLFSLEKKALLPIKDNKKET